MPLAAFIKSCFPVKLVLIRPFLKNELCMLSDVEIMKRVQAGDLGLFAHLVPRYQAKLIRFALSKLGNVQDAEDLVQEAFLAAYHARETYSPDFAFSTWIWTITLNLAKRHSRRRLRETETTLIQLKEGHHPASSTTPLEALITTEQNDRLDEWLADIPELQSDAIRLKFFGKLTYADIADAMDCSESGAKRRVKVGLQKLIQLAQSE